MFPTPQLQLALQEAGSGATLGVHMQGTDNTQGIIWAFDTTGTYWIYTQVRARGL